MAAESAPAGDDGVTGTQRVILDAVQKGFDYTQEVLDFGGPRFESEERGLDSPAYLREIDELIRGGYLERAANRYTGQLRLDLTEKGREAAPEVSEAEREIIDRYAIPMEAIRILNAVQDHRDREGSSPTTTTLQEEYRGDLTCYQYSLYFTRLVDAGLATGHGLFRYKIEPTDEGREVLEEFADDL